MEALLDNLLDISNIESGKYDLNKEGGMSQYIDNATNRHS